MFLFIYLFIFFFQGQMVAPCDLLMNLLWPFHTKNQRYIYSPPRSCQKDYRYIRRQYKAKNSNNSSARRFLNTISLVMRRYTQEVLYLGCGLRPGFPKAILILTQQLNCLLCHLTVHSYSMGLLPLTFQFLRLCIIVFYCLLHGQFLVCVYI